MSFGRVGIRIKWTKLSADESLEEDVLVSMGFHKKSYGSFLGRVRLLEADDDDASLLINDVSLDDMGKFRCEVIDGMDDVIHDSVGYSDGKSLSFYFLPLLSDGHIIPHITSPPSI
jgi:hyaluronan and proteoglycan link protein 1